MKRKVIDCLIEWKNSFNREPILLTGAKGVGKTYIAYDFAKSFFKQIVYVNFEREPESVKLFAASLSKGMEDLTNRLLQPFQNQEDDIKDNGVQERILILDEISFCPEVLFLIQSKEIYKFFPFIIAISCSSHSKEETKNFIEIPIYPLEFDEFLIASSNEWYIEAICNHYEKNQKIPDIVHNELLALHELYLKLGGMPGIINEYLNMSSLINIPEQHNQLISSYRDYIKQGFSDTDALKMNQVIDSLVLQLVKENRKFQYKLIRKGTTHTMYKDAIQNLVDRNYIIQCNKINNEMLLKSRNKLIRWEAFYKEFLSDGHFKLYYPDTGLLYTKMVEEKGKSEIVNLLKPILENYIAQTLQTKGYPFGFWESDSTAKIDFVIIKDGNIVPMEVHSNENTRSKSISILKENCDFPYAIKVSPKNFEYRNQVKYVPYYAAFCI